MGDSPISFQCSAGRRNISWRDRGERNEHEVVRTGRTKPNPSRRRGQRTLGELHEYECSCGHIGWTKHVEILYRPLKEAP